MQGTVTSKLAQPLCGAQLDGKQDAGLGACEHNSNLIS